jgi:O-antigen ligase
MKHYVVYAEVLMQSALLAWGLLVAAVLARKRLAWLLALAFTAIALTVAATDTRSAMGGILVGAFVVMMLVTPLKGRIVGMIGFALAALAGTAWIYHTRGYFWVDPRDIGSQYRWMIWHDGLRLIRGHPWFGVGMDSVKLFGTEWGVQAYRIFHVQGHFHSNFIQLAVERGLPALAAWIWLLVAYFVLLWRLLRRAALSDWFVRGAVLGLGASMIGLLVDSVVQYSLGEAPVLMLMWFLVGLTIVLDRIVVPQTVSNETPMKAGRPELVRS